MDRFFFRIFNKSASVHDDRVSFFSFADDAFLKARLFDPLGMASTGFQVAAADVGSCIETVLRDVGLSERRGDRARVLSGGQRQSIAIARAWR